MSTLPLRVQSLGVRRRWQAQYPPQNVVRLFKLHALLFCNAAQLPPHLIIDANLSGFHSALLVVRRPDVHAVSHETACVSRVYQYQRREYLNRSKRHHECRRMNPVKVAPSRRHAAIGRFSLRVIAFSSLFTIPPSISYSISPSMSIAATHLLEQHCCVVCLTTQRGCLTHIWHESCNCIQRANITIDDYAHHARRVKRKILNKINDLDRGGGATLMRCSKTPRLPSRSGSRIIAINI